MNNRIFDKSVNELADVITSISDNEQCLNFLTDLCSVSEIKSMAARLEIARMLKKGYVFSEIATKTGASNGDISRVKYALDYGVGGYNIILDKMGENDGTI